MTAIPTNPAQAGGVALTVTVAGRRLSVPLSRVRHLAEAGPLSPLPLAGPPFEGLVHIEGEVLVQLDLAALLGQAAGRQVAGRGRRLLVVTAGGGALALRVDDAELESPSGESPSGENRSEAEPFALEDHLPWARWRPVAAPPSEPRPLAATVALLRVEVDGRPLALAAGAVVQIARAEMTWPLPAIGGEAVAGGEGEGAVAWVDGQPFPARFLASSARARAGSGEKAGDEAAGGVAVVVGGPDGAWGALMVERALGVEVVPLAELHAVRSGGRATSWWWKRGAAAAVEVLEPERIFGWPGALRPPPPFDALAQAVAAAATPTAFDAVLITLGEVLVAVPVERVAGLLEGDVAVMDRWGRGGMAVFDAARLLGQPPLSRPGALVAVGRAEGGAAGGAHARVFACGRARPSSAIVWRPLDAAPPSTTALFDAVGWDEAAGRPVLRLGPFAPKSMSAALRRALAAARVGRLPADVFPSSPPAPPSPSDRAMPT